MIGFLFLHLIVTGAKHTLHPIIVIPLLGTATLMVSSSIFFNYQNIISLFVLGAILNIFELKIKPYRDTFLDKRLSMHLFDFPSELRAKDFLFYLQSYIPSVIILSLGFLLVGKVFDLSFGNPLFDIFIAILMVFSYSLNSLFKLPSWSVNGIERQSKEKLMAIHSNSVEGNSERLAFIIKSSSSYLNSKTNKGNAAIHLAIKAKQLKITKLLIDCGADLNITTAEELTPLMCAAKVHDIKTVKLLLDNNADPHFINSQNRNVLYYSMSNIKTFDLFINRSVDMNIISIYGDSLLSLAAAFKKNLTYLNKNRDVIKTDAKLLTSYLLEKGIDPNGLTEEKSIPLIKAVEASNDCVVELLLEQGANPNAKNEYQFTALSTAIDLCNSKLIKLLINKGAEINLKARSSFYSTEFFSPLEFAYRAIEPSAIEKEHLGNEIVDYIIAQGGVLGNSSHYVRIHLLREIRLLKETTFQQSILTLPKVSIDNETIELTPEEIDKHFMRRIIDKEIYLTMPFNYLSYLFELIVSVSQKDDRYLPDILVALFLNSPKKAAQNVLEAYNKYTEKKEHIEDCAEEVLYAANRSSKAFYNSNNTLISALAANTGAQHSIDKTLQESFLDALKNKKQKKEKADLMEALKFDFENAIKDTSLIPIYIKKSEIAAKISKNTQTLSFDFANYTTKLIIQSLKQSKYRLAEKLFFSYTDVIYLYSGLHEKSEDVASNGIVLYVLAKNERVIEQVFDVLLGTGFKVESIENPMLLYNLACYYARQEDKENLILVTQQAMKYGKKAAQFFADDDFKLFLNDRDFIELLQD